jgi:hypothetical protein
VANCRPIMLYGNLCPSSRKLGSLIGYALQFKKTHNCPRRGHPNQGGKYPLNPAISLILIYENMGLVPLFPTFRPNIAQKPNVSTVDTYMYRKQSTSCNYS